jgi:hypothetical protein
VLRTELFNFGEPLRMPRARPRAYGMGGAISREVERLLGWWGLGLRAVDWRVPEKDSGRGARIAMGVASR